MPFSSFPSPAATGDQTARETTFWRTCVLRSIEFDMQLNSPALQDTSRCWVDGLPAGGTAGGHVEPAVGTDERGRGRRHGAAPPAGSGPATAVRYSRWNLLQRDTLAHHIGVINAARAAQQSRHCTHSTRAIPATDSYRLLAPQSTRVFTAPPDCAAFQLLRVTAILSMPINISIT